MDPDYRPLRPEEHELVAYLWAMRDAQNALPPELMVADMDDGGMGSLAFASTKNCRPGGKIVGECSFIDADGVVVQAALFLDQGGELFELDLWKVNFEPLVRIPSRSSFSPLRSQA